MPTPYLSYSRLLTSAYFSLHQDVVIMISWLVWEWVSNEASPIIPLLMWLFGSHWKENFPDLSNQDHHQQRCLQNNSAGKNGTNNACSLVGKEIVNRIILLLYWIIKSHIVLRFSTLAARWIRRLSNKVIKCCAVICEARRMKAATH